MTAYQGSSRILVVGDDAVAREALSCILRDHGFDVVEATTGEQALRLGTTEQPDLVVLDVNLPDSRGVDVARQMKDDELTRNTPILQLSSSSLRSVDGVNGLAAAADAYLVEPVEPGELIANIRALLRLRHAEAGLRRTTAMLAGVIDSSPLAIAVFDDDQSILRWNRAAERLFGIRAGEAEGRSASEGLLPPSLALPHDVADWLAGGNVIGPLEYAYVRADNATIDVAMFGAPIDRAAGYVAIFEDISNRKRFERERTEWLARERDARTEAEAANRLKDEFLATLSHELRTPLNAILGWLLMLRRETSEEKRERALEIIERNARAQQQIINDILEVSQIVRGQLRLEMQEVDMASAVETAVESVRPTSVAKRQTLTMALPIGPVPVAGDPARVQQMLWNLLANATKYTPRDGHIQVSVTRGDLDVEITVKDDGIGIPAHMLPYVFERFRQGDAARRGNTAASASDSPLCDISPTCTGAPCVSRARGAGRARRSRCRCR